MDRKTLLAIGLAFAGLMIWQRMTARPPSAVGTAGQPSVVSSGAALGAPEVKAVQAPIEKIDVKVEASQPQIGTGTWFFTDWKLNHYRQGGVDKKNAPLINLTTVTEELGNIQFATDSPEYEYLSNPRAEIVGKIVSQSDKALLWRYEDEKILLEREYRFTEESYAVDVKVTAHFKSKAPQFGFISLFMNAPDSDPEAQDRKLAAWTKGDIETHLLKSGIPLQEIGEPLKWIAAISRYFVLTVLPQGEGSVKGLIQPTGAHGGRISLVYPIASDTVTFPLKVYFGAKDLAVLHAVEPTLDHTVDFGWFTIVAYPLLRLMKWLYEFVQNYGVAIFLLTVLVKVATFPLTYKSMKGMKQMAKLQPQLKKLQERYKDDREGLNREMITFMRSNGYNPLAGCWPMLIQMPVFFALYRVLYSSVELYQAPFALWYHDLSSKDPYYVMPVLVSIVWFVQQKLSPQTTTDPMQQKIFQFMPLIFGVFMLTLPAGLGIYFLTNASLTIVQQLILNKKFDENRSGAPKPVRA